MISASKPKFLRANEISSSTVSLKSWWSGFWKTKPTFLARAATLDLVVPYHLFVRCQLRVSATIEVFDEGGFACAVLPHNGNEFAVFDGDGNAFEGFYLAGYE